MDKKLAIIDCGTNTFHLLITWLKKEPGTLVHQRRTVKIGQGGIEKKIILPEAQERALKVLKEYAALIRLHNVDEVRAFATSAFRSAVNGMEFRDRILRETGILITIIPGEEEAEWIYKGVRKALSMDDQTDLIMDIGGGSVEFILANQKEILWKQSFEIGAQRLLDRFFDADPIPRERVRALQEYLTGQLQPLLEACQRYTPVILLGASGTFDTLSNMYQLARGNTPDFSAPELPLTYQGFLELYELLLAKDREQRLKIPGMIEMRVDMIVVASCLLEFVLRTLDLRNIRVSRYALKEGVLADASQAQI